MFDIWHRQEGATVADINRSGDVDGVITGQERSKVGDILGLANTLHQHVRRQSIEHGKGSALIETQRSTD